MKKHYQILLFSLFNYFTLLLSSNVRAQCPGGYTQSQLNWDNLDYYYNSGNNLPPYGHNFGGSNNYITNAMEQTQRFAIGTNYMTFATSVAGLVQGENTSHTGDIAGYTGADAQFTPTATNQTVTITFVNPVLNANFTLYDIDHGAVMTLNAFNPSGFPLSVVANTQTPTILTVTGTPGKTISDLTNTSLANNDNRGTVTINIAGSIGNPVKSVIINITTLGMDPTYWLSDIKACVTGSFPTNWHQGFNNRPLQGFTQNQPDYFIVTPDNKSAYMMDPATGRCWWLFSETSSHPYINTFAYDPANKYLYYVTDASSSPYTNKTLKRYNFNTEAIETVVADITTTLNMPTFQQGVESASAAFYNGVLYIGIEGGRHGSGSSTVTRESITWAITFDANQNPISANQVMAIPAFINGTDSSFHDWGDIIIKNGTIYSFNVARAGSSPIRYKYSAYHHFNMLTGNMDQYYINPNQNNRYAGQAGMNWAGELFFIRDSVGKYNENGTNSNTLYRPVVQSVPGDPVPPGWVGNAGDASDPFRPKCDFGDAPASYDPNSLSPAVHERSETIRLGATWDREWVKRGTSGTDDVDDGTPFVHFFSPTANSYLAHTYVSNNSGAAATLIAWLDYNGNGVFDASEAITPINVPNGTNNQLYFLYWPAAPTPLSNGQFTYMRVRVTSASAGMTSAHATGYFTNGEVEDYRIPVDNFPLSVSNISFNATIVNNNYAKLNWTSQEQQGFGGYEVQKSRDAVNWEFIALVAASGQSGQHSYDFTDDNLEYGKTYYRLKLIGVNGNNKYSEIRFVTKLISPAESIILKTNPVKNSAIISIQTNTPSVAEMILFTEIGKKIFYEKKTVTAGINTITIPVKPEWPAGTYLLKITLNNETVTKKIVIEK